MNLFDQSTNQLSPDNVPKTLFHTIRLSIFIPSTIAALAFTAVLVLLWNHFNQPLNGEKQISTFIPDEVVSPTPLMPTIASFPTTTATVTPRPTKSIIPTSSPRPTSTPVITTGKLSLNFHVLYTQEPIEDYKVTIYKQSDQSIVSTSVGSGNNYSIDNLKADSYKIHVQIGRNDKYCGSSGNGIDSSTVNFYIKAGQTTNLTADIYPYPGFIYLKTKNGYPIANAIVNTGFYSATTDSLGRVVLYSINPGPFNLNVSYQGNDFNHQTSGSDCMWLQTIVSPLTTFSSTVSVTINSTVDYLSLTPELIIKETPLNINPNAIGNGLVYDEIRKFSLDLSHCPGLNGTYYRFGGMASLYPPGFDRTGDNGNPVMLTQIDSGNYDVCVYDSGKSSSYASSVTSISVNNGNPVFTTIDYPKK